MMILAGRRARRALLFVGWLIAPASGAFLWLGFHRPAEGIMCGITSLGSTLMHKRWRPSRWLYLVAAMFFVCGMILAAQVNSAWFLLVAVSCALGPAVAGVRFLHDPDAFDYDEEAVDEFFGNSTHSFCRRTDPHSYLMSNG